jgi:hypothetical protein
LSGEFEEMESDAPRILWLRVSSRGKAAGQYRIPLQVSAGDAQATLTRAW